MCINETPAGRGLNRVAQSPPWVRDGTRPTKHIRCRFWSNKVRKRKKVFPGVIGVSRSVRLITNLMVSANTAPQLTIDGKIMGKKDGSQSSTLRAPLLLAGSHIRQRQFGGINLWQTSHDDPLARSITRSMVDGRPSQIM